MIGVNDIRHNICMDSILTNYNRIIKTIKAESPKTRIIIQSVLPVNNKIGKPKTTNVQVDSLNNFIKNMTRKFNIPYVDINSKLKDVEGRLDKKYTEDGLHINGNGYLVWKSVIEKYINN
jgi:lysophospholipase L1-like esterase